MGPNSDVDIAIEKALDAEEYFALKVIAELYAALGRYAGRLE